MLMAAGIADATLNIPERQEYQHRDLLEHYGDYEHTRPQHYADTHHNYAEHYIDAPVEHHRYYETEHHVAPVHHAD